MAVTQDKWRVQVYQGASTASPLVYDTGWQVTQVSDYNLPSGVLQNSLTYTIVVSVIDSNGIMSSDSNTFSTSWTPPSAPSFSVDASAMENNGYVSVTWSNTVRDTSWISWRVYRTPSTGTPVYTLVYETTVDQSSYTYHDFLVGSGLGYKYVVVQVANRFGSPVESVYALSAEIVPVSTHYWLIDANPDNLGFQIKIPNVTADSYTDVYEKQELNLIGRGRKLDYGTRWGYSGSLTARLYDDAFTGITARQKKQTLEAQKSLKRPVYLRDPFGNLTYIALDDMQISRIAAVGTREFCDLTLPYLEITSI